MRRFLHCFLAISCVSVIFRSIPNELVLYSFPFSCGHPRKASVQTICFRSALSIAHRDPCGCIASSLSLCVCYLRSIINELVQYGFRFPCGHPSSALAQTILSCSALPIACSDPFAYLHCLFSISVCLLSLVAFLSN